MTKAELLKALEPFGDDQYVFVRLHTARGAAMIIIQGVQATPPWHAGVPDLIGLLCDECNRDSACPATQPPSEMTARVLSGLIANTMARLRAVSCTCRKDVHGYGSVEECIRCRELRRFGGQEGLT